MRVSAMLGGGGGGGGVTGTCPRGKFKYSDMLSGAIWVLMLIGKCQDSILNKK